MQFINSYHGKRNFLGYGFMPPQVGMHTSLGTTAPESGMVEHFILTSSIHFIFQYYTSHPWSLSYLLF